MRKFIGILIILAGLLIMLYPRMSELIKDKKQDTLLSSYEETMLVLSEKNNQIIEEITIVIDLTDQGDELKSVDTVETFNEIPDFEPKVKEKVYTRDERNAYITSGWPVEAILEIDKINLLMPIIEGTREDYLDVSVCSLTGTSKPWDSGNYAIAGHRSLTYGRHFNRLDELVDGDKVRVRTLDNEIFDYQVYDISIVHEKDLSVLEELDFDEVTLITCDPIGTKNPEYRLIVKAKKIKPLN